MSMKSSAVGLAIGLTMAVAIGRAEAREIPFNGSYSGTFRETQIDTNGDGAKAEWAMFTANTNLGEVTAQFVIEDSILPEPVTCPEGNLEFTGVVRRLVLRFPNGDLLFTEGLTRTGCFDPATGTFSINNTATFSGGTGKFAGATGSFEDNLTGGVLAFDPVTFQGFGHFTGEFTATIITSD